MKKTVLFAMAAISALTLFGCSKKAETKQTASDEKKLVVCGSNTEALVTAMLAVFGQEQESRLNIFQWERARPSNELKQK